MGFVLFKVAYRRFGQIDVTDRHGLADRRNDLAVRWHDEHEDNL